jgi:hypothetical protein
MHLNIKSGYSTQNALLREDARHVFAWVTGQEQDDRARTSHCQGKASQSQSKDKLVPGRDKPITGQGQAIATTMDDGAGSSSRGVAGVEGK